jgi:hypothetical protein
MSKEVIKLITERKMSDAKDMIDSILKSKLAESIDMFYEKNLDPVGQEDGDIDNDGDEDDTDKYLLNRRKKIGQAMKKEDVDHIEEGAPDTELDHHRGRNPDVFEDDYLPMTKKKGVTHKAMGKKKAGGSY